jgi:DNA mismatch repair protein MutL
MMGKIKILDQFLIDRIAAGEVVQRPLNVVKELVENSIDAQASAIVIEIKQGGKQLVRITDNGVGMSSDDALMSFKRHATSKISNAQDLEAIGTLGFRGEALCVIAAVSHMDIITRSAEQTSGIVLNISGGKLVSKKRVGMAVGTSVVIKNLFYNTPARLKFLKQKGTESAAVFDIVSKLILSFPNIAFKFIVDDKITLQSFGEGKLIDSIASVYGDDVKKNLLSVNYLDGDIKILGYIGKPQYAYKNRKMQSIFINGRFVIAPKIAGYIKKAYANWLVSGLFPFYVLNISVPVFDIDVNIHPNKLEVKFKDDTAIENAVLEAIGFTLEATNPVPNIVLSDDKKKENPDDSDINEHQPYIKKPIQAIEVEHLTKHDERTDEGKTSIDFDIISPKNTVVKNQAFLQNEDEQGFKADVIKDIAFEDDEKQVENVAFDQAKNATPRYIGSFLNAYLLVELGENLILIDQHAAHEKIIFDALLSQYKNESPNAQMLMISQRIILSLEEKKVITDHCDILKNLGFVFSINDDLSVDFSGVPSVLSHCNVDELLDDFLASMDSGEVDMQKRIDQIIMKSCKRAIKAGHNIGYKQAEYLVEEFIQSGGVPACPHGRPVMTVLSEKEIKKVFRRIV